MCAQIVRWCLHWRISLLHYSFFFYSFFFFSGKGWSWLIALLFQIFTIYSKLLHFGVLSKSANNRFNHTGFRFLRLNRPVSGFPRLLDDFRFLVIIGPDWRPVPGWTGQIGQSGPVFKTMGRTGYFKKFINFIYIYIYKTLFKGL